VATKLKGQLRKDVKVVFDILVHGIELQINWIGEAIVVELNYRTSRLG